MENEREDFTQQLINKAIDGKHSDVEILTNLGMLRIARAYRSGLKKIVTSFRDSADQMFDEYIKLLDKKVDDNGHLLFEYRIMRQCQKFYEEEVNITNYMIWDYIDYIHSGHLIDTLLGVERPGDQHGEEQ